MFNFIIGDYQECFDSSKGSTKLVKVSTIAPLLYFYCKEYAFLSLYILTFFFFFFETDGSFFASRICSMDQQQCYKFPSDLTTLLLYTNLILVIYLVT